MMDIDMEYIIDEHGPIIDVEEWMYGTIVTFADRFQLWLGVDDDCD